MDPQVDPLDLDRFFLSPWTIFFPRKHISTAGGKISFDILAEEVEALTAASFNLNFNVFIYFNC